MASVLIPIYFDYASALCYVAWKIVNELERAVASVFGLLSRTAAAGSHELLLVAAQNEFVAPTHAFQALPL